VRTTNDGGRRRIRSFRRGKKREKAICVDVKTTDDRLEKRKRPNSPCGNNTTVTI